MKEEIEERIKQLEKKLESGEPLTKEDHHFLYTINLIQQNG